MTYVDVEIEIEEGLQEEAEKLLAEQGYTLEQAIQMFYKYVAVNKKLPFDIDNEEPKL